MLTIEIKRNGVVIAEVGVVPCGDIVNDGTQVTDDFDVQWTEDQGEDFEAIRDADGFVIRGHRRHQTVWALVAKAAAAILGQKVERMEAAADEKPGQARVWEQVGRDHK